MYCKYCGKEISYSERSYHNCKKKGLLSVDSGDSFLVSTIIGAVTDSAIIGGILGGSILGGMLGDVFDGDLMD